MFENRILDELNEEQKRAVLESFDTNTVVIAGAGSGKTKTLTARVGYILDEIGARESEIMVVTFTNKAANELKGRMAMVTTNIEDMYIGTFHSICIKLLKEYGSYIGIDKFSVMDTYKAKKVLKEVLENLNIDTDVSTINKYMNLISKAKCDMKTTKALMGEAKSESEQLFIRVYTDYKNKCWKDKTFDFDDLIIYSVVLLSKSKEVKEDVHLRFKYICCDETQDTNSAQFKFLYHLAGDNNLFLVGDEGQSIYSFRKAKPAYILNFKSLYPDAKILHLNRNYRSTQTIVNASNDLVNNNTVGFKKECYSKNEKGDPIIITNSLFPEDEAEFVATEAKLLHKGGLAYEDMAVLFRTNMQSRVLEEACRREGIPVVVVDGISFYNRKEIKDVLAFAKILVDPFDIESFKRVCSLLPGVGKKTIELVENIGKTSFEGYAQTFLELKVSAKAEASKAILRKVLAIDLNEDVGRSIEEVAYFSNIISNLLKEGTEVAIGRVDNIKELINIAIDFKNLNPKKKLSDFIDEIALSELEGDGVAKKGLNLLTIHASKGLEFNTCFVVGMEENVLPHFRSKGGSALEEERRIAYVAVSRAEKRLYLSHCEYRKDGENSIKSTRSRFIDEIPEKYTICL